MLQTARSTHGMVVAPHRLAAQAGLEVLRDGGTAIEAMVAAAATVSVVYPHMNGLGGDGFWLISTPDERPPQAVNAVGAAAAAADESYYRARGLDAVPSRGPLAANTVAGTVSGWQAALEINQAWGGGLPLARLLEPAIGYARDGFPASEGQGRLTEAKRGELADVPGWAALFLPDAAVPAPGAIFKQPALAETLGRLAEAGLDDFYRGTLAKRIAADLARAGSPVSAEDLARHRPTRRPPLSVKLRAGTVYNVAPPSQGLASLMILGLFDRLGCTEAEGFEHIHGLVEATKRAFLVRNAEITDPAHMTLDPETMLEAATLDETAAQIDRRKAMPWPVPGTQADTVWLGAADAEGRVVSFIHSIYWEFGSGLCLRDSGIQWQNRGSSFSLDSDGQNYLLPGRFPFHTNNPAMALLEDGRIMAYGSMGGDGQPQTQAAVFTRHVLFGQDLQRAITAPRWVLSRTWGEPRDDLRIESRVDPTLVEALRRAGHDVSPVAPFDEVMGHAGAVVWHPSGLMEGASDPRSDGTAAAF